MTNHSLVAFYRTRVEFNHVRMIFQHLIFELADNAQSSRGPVNQLSLVISSL